LGPLRDAAELSKEERTGYRYAVELDYLLPDGSLELLTRARKGGIVLDYIVARSDQDLNDVRVLREIVDVTVAGFCALRGLPTDTEVDVDSLPADRITVDEFYGWRFDRARRRLLIEGRELFEEDRERYIDEPTEGIRQIHIPWVWSDTPRIPYTGSIAVDRSGYADAFLDPPYRLHLRPREAADLFLVIDDLLLGQPNDSTEVWRFSSGGSGPILEDAWSPYFLGSLIVSCVWTIRRDAEELVIIGSSASD
jgi:hypothetical protein